MIQYIKEVIVPYIRARQDILKDEEQTALAIFDCFKGQVTNNVIDMLEEHNIQSVIVPGGCTDRLQPLDLSVNRSAKAFLRSQFQEWYSQQISNQLDTQDKELEAIDLSTA